MRLIVNEGRRLDRQMPLSEMWLQSLRKIPRGQTPPEWEIALRNALDLEHRERERIRYGARVEGETTKRTETSNIMSCGGGFR
jgi:hypothetical protein